MFGALMVLDAGDIVDIFLPCMLFLLKPVHHVAQQALERDVDKAKSLLVGFPVGVVFAEIRRNFCRSIKTDDRLVEGGFGKGQEGNGQ